MGDCLSPRALALWANLPGPDQEGLAELGIEEWTMPGLIRGAATEGKTMTTGIRLLVIAALASVAIAGCSSSSEDTTAGGAASASSTASAPASAAAGSSTEWADGICSSASQLRTSLDALGSSLKVDLGSGDALAQLKDQVGAQMQVIAADLAQLSDAVTAVPEDASPEVQAAADQIRTDRDAVGEAVDGLQASAAQIGSAQDLRSGASAVTATAAQLATTTSAAATLFGDLGDLASSGSDAVRSAFAEAPSCAAFGDG